jgi:hypothetical protein
MQDLFIIKERHATDSHPKMKTKDKTQLLFNHSFRYILSSQIYATSSNHARLTHNRRSRQKKRSCFFVTPYAILSSKIYASSSRQKNDKIHSSDANRSSRGDCSSFCLRLVRCVHSRLRIDLPIAFKSARQNFRFKKDKAEVSLPAFAQ